MTCLGCTQVETGPVKTLIDGRVVCHQCEDWRAECEARWVCSLPSIRERREFIGKVARARGDDAADKLKLDIRRVWEAQREVAQNTRSK